MARIGALVAAALALGACHGDGKAAAGQTVSVTGVIASADDKAVRVRTDDGRQLTLNMNDTVAVTLAGGEAQAAVITEGAPVRVSYRPKGSGGDLVTIDVEPQATNGRGELRDTPQAEPPANPERARQGR